MKGNIYIKLFKKTRKSENKKCERRKGKRKKPGGHCILY